MNISRVEGRLTARAEWRRGWPVATASAIGYATSYSEFGYVVSIFVTVLSDNLGWSRGAIALAGNASLAGGLAAPLWGRAIDRWGVRPVLLLALPILGLAYLLMGRVSEIWQYYALYAVTAVFGIACTTMTFGRAISSWFTTSRGLALSTTGIALTLMGVALPPSLYAINEHFGWHAVFYTMGALPLLIALPAAALFVRERPGAALVPVDPVAQDVMTERWHRQIRRPRYWALTIATSLTVGTVVGLMSQLQPLLTDSGIDGATAAALLGVLGASTLAGALICGLIIDRVWGPMIGFAFTSLPVLGCLLLMSAHGPLIAGAAIGLVGLAYGVELQIFGYLMARYFGLRTFGTLVGIYNFLSTLFCAVWMSGFGLTFDYFGSYRPVLSGAAASFALSAMLFLTLGRYPDDAAHRKPTVA